MLSTLGPLGASSLLLGETGVPIKPRLSGTPLRGYTITGVGGGVVQSRGSSSASYANTTLSHTGFLINNGTANTGLPGFEYRLVSGANISPSIGPTGISDTTTNTLNAFYEPASSQDLMDINTPTGGGSGLIPGVDYADIMTFYTADLGSNVTINYRAPAGRSSVLGYVFNCRNNYDSGVPSLPVAAAIQHSNIDTNGFTYTCNLVDPNAAVGNYNLLPEHFASNSATSVASTTSSQLVGKETEIGIMPIVSISGRNYFNASAIEIGTYTDENALSWQVVSAPPPSSIYSGLSSYARYIVALEPNGTPRLVASFQHGRYFNWLIAQNLLRSSDWMTGFAAGLEIVTGSGTVTGQILPTPAAMPWAAAPAHTFDTDVAAYFARFSNAPGYAVRVAVDTFITGLKSNSLYTLLDEIYFFHAAGKLDVRRAFKSASHDIVDQVGTAGYVIGQGISYAGAGYGSTGFNPSIAAGQYAQDSAFLFAFVEADAGAVSAKLIGNATANMGRDTAGASLSHQLNDAAAQFGGSYLSLLPVGYSLRRVAGAGPGGTGGSAGYQVKRTGSTTALFDATATSTALTNANLELGRAGSGTVYSQAVFSGMAYGSGMTNTQVDTFNSLWVTMRSAVKAAGL